MQNYRYDFLNETNVSEMRKRYMSALTTVIQNHTANFILGEIDIDTGWDDYIAELESNGMDEYLGEIAKAPLVSAYLEGRIEY